MYLKDKTMQFCIRIDEETWKKVRIICMEKNLSRSQYLRSLVYEAVCRDFENLWENDNDISFTYAASDLIENE